MSNEIVYKTISFTDLEAYGLVLGVVDNKITGAAYKGKSVGLGQVYKALSDLGIKNDQHVQVQDKTEHRRANGQQTNNYRVIGRERNDKAWLESGYASDEAKLSSSKMKDMVGFVSKLSSGGDN